MHIRQKRTRLFTAVFTILSAVSGFMGWTLTGTASAATCSSSQAFKITVDTTRTGGTSTTTNTQFRLPTTGTGYSYTVDINGDDDWADVSPGSSNFNETTSRTGTIIIEFGTPGTYQLAICGSFPRIYFNNTGDKDKLISVDQWGDNAWGTSQYASYWGASNMEVLATDTPDFSGVTTLSSMFQDASSLVGNSSFNNWDVSTITSLASMFRGASEFNSPIGNWDTAQVTNMSNLFFRAEKFNQPIGNWDTGNVIDMTALFREAAAFNQDISGWNTGHVIGMTSMFNSASSFNQPLNDWDVSNVTVMTGMFNHASAFNQPLNKWDVGNVTNMRQMFGGVRQRALDTVPDTVLYVASMSFDQDLSAWDTSKVTNMSGMFGVDPEAMRASYESLGYTNITIVANPTATVAFSHSLANWDMSNVTAAFGMLSGTKLPRASYDATLAGWAAQSLQSGVTLDAYSLAYCQATADRQSLIDDFNWIINSDTYNCAASVTTTSPSNPVGSSALEQENLPSPPNTGFHVVLGNPLTVGFFGLVSAITLLAVRRVVQR